MIPVIKTNSHPLYLGIHTLAMKAVLWWQLCVALRLLAPYVQGADRSLNLITSEYRRNAIRLLSDLSRHEAVPTSVFLLACWTPSENVAMAKSFGGTVTILRHSANQSIEVPIALNVNRVEFVMDLDCEWQDGWLNRVGIYLVLFVERI